MIVKYIALIFSAAFETYYANLFYSTFMKRKLERSKHILFLSLFFVIQAVNSLLNIEEILFFVSVLFCIDIALIFEGKIIMRLGLACLFAVITVSAEYIASAIVMLIADNNIDLIYDNIIFYLIVLISSKFLTFLIILLIKISFNRFGNIYLRRKDMLLIMSLPIATMLTMFMMCRTLVKIDDRVLNIMYILSSGFLIIANVIIVEVIKHQSELVKSKVELAYAQKSLNEQKAHYQALMSSQKEIRSIRHDEKKSLYGNSRLARRG